MPAVGGFIRVANASVILCCVCSGKILNWDTECTATVCTNVATCHGHCLVIVWFSSVFTVHLFFLTFKSSTTCQRLPPGGITFTVVDAVKKMTKYKRIQI
jgi:hypothetical protein